MTSSLEIEIEAVPSQQMPPDDDSSTEDAVTEENADGAAYDALGRLSPMCAASARKHLPLVSTPATCASSLPSTASPLNTSIESGYDCNVAMEASAAAALPSKTAVHSITPQASSSVRKSIQMRLPIPSPVSRSSASQCRVDPRYAARLLEQPRVLPRSHSNASSTDEHMPPPPTVRRINNHQFYRPTPIVTATPPPQDTSIGPFQLAQDGMANILVSPRLVQSARHGGMTAAMPGTGRSTASEAGTTPADRYIPSRATSNFYFNLWEGHQQRQCVAARTATSPRHGRHSLNSGTNTPSAAAGAGGAVDVDTSPDAAAAAAASTSVIGSELMYSPHMATTAGAQSQQQQLLNTLLRSELLGENDNPRLAMSIHGGGGGRSAGPDSSAATNPLRDGAHTTNHLRYISPRQAFQDSVFESGGGRLDLDGASRWTAARGGYDYDPGVVMNAYSLTPVRSAAAQRLLAAPPKRKRRISKVPFKVLDAPALQDDFYLNLVDWSSQNVLAVALGACVYLWSAYTSKVTKLCDLSSTEDLVTSVSWAQRGVHLAVGTNRGETQLWDTVKSKRIRSLGGHSARVGTLAWSGPILASGSRDRIIYLRDVRMQAPFTDSLAHHKQEVCGLKWSHDEPAFLASGGNDNHLFVIDSRNPTPPVHKFSEHTAAVKAIAWSPHQQGLLASGGGTADRCIRFWNTLSGQALNKVDTGSQVCNLAWSQNCNEIVSTHGYSLNQIIVWRYPNMSKVTTLTGHTYRVLYLAMSPDGSTVVTGAGDETLRFWQVFPGPRSDGKDGADGLLFPKTIGSVIR